MVLQWTKGGDDEMVGHGWKEVRKKGNGRTDQHCKSRTASSEHEHEESELLHHCVLFFCCQIMKFWMSSNNAKNGKMSK